MTGSRPSARSTPAWPGSPGRSTLASEGRRRKSAGGDRAAEKGEREQVREASQ